MASTKSKGTKRAAPAQHKEARPAQKVQSKTGGTRRRKQPAAAPSPDPIGDDLLLLDEPPAPSGDPLAGALPLEVLDGDVQIGEERSSVLAAGDVDADASETGSGEEAVGGSTPTPDQDNVDQIGEALGVVYQDNESLRPDEKLAKRDVDRWELHPASAEDFQERQNLAHAMPEKRRRRGR